MANPIARSLIEASLLKKGFTKDKRDHRVYVFYHKGKKTSARTKISTGTGYKVYDDNLLGKMKRQLLLDTNQEVRDLVSCPMSQAEYTKILIGRNRIEP